ncbi:hypothetical protein J2S23_000225 [Streptococcus moroccensis]|uniref:Integrase n=1 Tax=Streptococcus moroccensis TaxID=1451356 RepID=A0ABT9YNY1_9STRE|nr:hypothetical protein [Streptococcus moroccensis]
MEIKSYQKKGQTFYKFTFYIGMVDGKRKYIKRANFKTKKKLEPPLCYCKKKSKNQKVK